MTSQFPTTPQIASLPIPPPPPEGPPPPSPPTPAPIHRPVPVQPWRPPVPETPVDPDPTPLVPDPHEPPGDPESAPGPPRASAANAKGAIAAAWLGALCIVAAGCTARISPEPGPTPFAAPAGTVSCGADSNVVCAEGTGWSCTAGTAPTDLVSNLSCSVPTADGPYYDYCCFEWRYGSTCTPDDALTSVCRPGTFGYRCQAGDDPNSRDPALNCSAPVPDGPDDDFCCR
jgi:hypothetical protein